MTFLKGLVRRGLRGVKLVISDAHEGLKAAIRRVVGASWQRCRVGLLKMPRFFDSLPMQTCRGSIRCLAVSRGVNSS